MGSQRKVSLKDFQDEALNIARYKTEYGFNIKESSGLYDFEVITPCGILQFTFRESLTNQDANLMMRFREPQRAIALGVDCNQHTGKWNHYEVDTNALAIRIQQVFTASAVRNEIDLESQFVVDFIAAMEFVTNVGDDGDEKFLDLEDSPLSGELKQRILNQCALFTAYAQPALQSYQDMIKAGEISPQCSAGHDFGMAISGSGCSFTDCGSSEVLEVLNETVWQLFGHDNNWYVGDDGLVYC